MKNLNRRRYVLNKKVLLNILLLIIITIIITIVYFEKKNISILIKNTIQSFSQNFAYNSEDWQIITAPQNIIAITEDSYFIYFASEDIKNIIVPTMSSGSNIPLELHSAL